MRWIAGILLVGAAALKAGQLIFDPVAAVMNPLGRYFLPGQVGVELALGLLVLSGLYWRTLRWGVVVLFTAFAGYSLYLAIGGAASCGCFGPLRVNPWWTFALDLFVAIGLLSSTLLEGRRLASAPLSSRVSGHQALAVVVGVTAICTTFLIRYAGQQTAVAGGLLTTVGDLVILEPEKWIGQQLPIAQSIDFDLSAGEWIVLLHRHDCPACQEQVPRYEQRAAAGERIALVEVPPFGDIEPQGEAAQYGRLRIDHEWFVQTPIEIQLHDGIVRAVKAFGNEMHFE